MRELCIRFNYHYQVDSYKQLDGVQSIWLGNIYTLWEYQFPYCSPYRSVLGE